MDSNNYIPDAEAEKEISTELYNGEKLLWAGRPKKGLIISGWDAWLFPFSIFWFCGIIYFEVMAIKTWQPFLMFWGLPFIAMGLYITIGRFWRATKKREHTFYGLTTERVLIKTTAFGQSLSAIEISKIPKLSLEHNIQDYCTIYFEPTDLRTTMVGDGGWPGVNKPARFEHIKGARFVYNKILELKRHT